MSKIFAICSLLACLFQGYHFLDRAEIITEYTPILAERTSNFTADVSRVNSSYNIILTELKNTTITTMAALTLQITALKTNIANIRNVSANNSAIISCVAETDADVKLLSAEPLNATCYWGVTYPEFLAARNAFQVLAAIPGETIAACESLDPLPSQDEQFFDCIAKKVLDLDQQTELLNQTFDKKEKETLATLTQCLGNQSALISANINQINFQVTLCSSLV